MEIWKDVVVGDRPYQVSSLGRIRSLDCVIMRKDGKPMRKRGAVLNLAPNSRGYCRVSIHNGARQVSFGVHSLVASAFLPPPPGPLGTHRGGYVVNHKDGNKTNNAVENLEYVTTEENYRHAVENRLIIHKGAYNGNAKLRDEAILEIRQLYRLGARQVDLAKQFGVTQTTISKIVLGHNWTHIKSPATQQDKPLETTR